MKYFIIGILTLFCAVGNLQAQTTKGDSQKLTLRVTSSSDKQISFVASIFFKTDKARLDYTMQQTPYEITVESDYVNATIIKTSGDGDLVVDLVKAKKVGDQPDLKASSSTIVVVGTQKAEKGIYYQQTF
jgi:hypothetical protein